VNHQLLARSPRLIQQQRERWHADTAVRIWDRRPWCR